MAALRALGPVVERPNTYGAGTGVTYHPEHLKVVWERLVPEAGAAVLLHAFVQDVIVRDGRVEGVWSPPRPAWRRIEADVVIDASGDADVCLFAGFGYRDGRRARAGPDADDHLPAGQRGHGPCAGRSTRAAFHALMAEAAESGAYDLPRREGCDHITPVPGMTATVMTRVEADRDDRADGRHRSTPPTPGS